MALAQVMHVQVLTVATPPKNHTYIVEAFIYNTLASHFQQVIKKHFYEEARIEKGQEMIDDERRRERDQ